MVSGSNLYFGRICDGPGLASDGEDIAPHVPNLRHGSIAGSDWKKY